MSCRYRIASPVDEVSLCSHLNTTYLTMSKLFLFSTGVAPGIFAAISAIYSSQSVQTSRIGSSILYLVISYSVSTKQNSCLVQFGLLQRVDVCLRDISNINPRWPFLRRDF